MAVIPDMLALQSSLRLDLDWANLSMQYERRCVSILGSS